MMISGQWAMSLFIYIFICPMNKKDEDVPKQDKVDEALKFQIVISPNFKGFHALSSILLFLWLF